MKKIILIVVMVLFAVTNLSAMTIETESKRNTVYNQPTKVQESFGKRPFTEEYGIFLSVSCKAVEGESDHESLFYRLNCEVVKEGKYLQAIIDGKKIMLAEKKWYGWVIADGVKIQHSMERTPYPTFKVWVEVE